LNNGKTNNQLSTLQEIRCAFACGLRGRHIVPDISFQQAEEARNNEGKSSILKMLDFLVNKASDDKLLG